MHCIDCNSKNIKTRKNFSHGKKSKAITSKICKDCGSSNIEVPKVFVKYRRR